MCKFTVSNIVIPFPYSCIHGLELIIQLVYKKIAIILVTTVLLASCGALRSPVSHREAATSATQNDIVGYGKKYLGKPYRYAGRGPQSFDCSGFTAFVFREFGYKLSPSSAGQEKQFPSVTRKENLQPGDLVFFEGRRKNGKVGHVGIVTETRSNGEFRFVHASTGYGVIITSSGEEYWASRYLRGGRVLKGNEAVLSRRAPSGHQKDHRFTPAIAKDEAEKKVVPVVLPMGEKEITTAGTAQSKVVASTVSEAAVKAVIEEETKILVQLDPAKNPPLKSDHPSEDKKNNTIDQTHNTIILREDSLEVPDPVLTEIEEPSPESHTVKMGETLYSISRRYNCSVDQLRAWNPQLKEILKVGDIIRLSN